VMMQGLPPRGGVACVLTLRIRERRRMNGSSRARRYSPVMDRTSPGPPGSRSVPRKSNLLGIRCNCVACPVSLRRLRLSRGSLTTGQKSAEGIVGHVVGKASEALRNRKVESTDRPSRER